MASTVEHAHGIGASLGRRVLLSCIPMLYAASVYAQDASDLATMSLEELAGLTITSVSKRQESLAAAIASVYVITAEDIRRSGVTTLPEALRLAPNLQVAQVDGVQYAITARGFNNTIGNKLLVLLDGRTLYTPLFSGVFWDMQDTLLQDVERIEVISGPGGTLWGANAVNGVINIITRPAAATTGTVLAGEAGTHEDGIAARAGWRLGPDGPALRVYAKAREWASGIDGSGVRVLDEWRRVQMGFRADWGEADDGFTLQGDVYDGESEHRGVVAGLSIPAIEIAGANLLARWNRPMAGGGALRAQAYWDRADRDEFVLFSPASDIIDVDVQYGRPLAAHYMMVGGGYRRARDDVDPGVFTAVLPDSRNLDWQNVFLRDEWTLSPVLRAVLGLKFERNDYTGVETLPSMRLAWTPREDHLVWGSLSRPIRAPSRFDRDVYVPREPPYIVAGGPDFQAEKAVVAELGYRGQWSDRFNLSVTLYHHDWRQLRSGTSLPLPIYLVNDIEGEVYGLEAWANWQPLPFWRLTAGVTTLAKDLRFRPGHVDTVGVDNPTLHNDPDHQWQLRSSMDLGTDVQFDLFLRDVDELTVESVPGYTELNAHLAWLPVRGLEFTLTGRNLLHAEHAEFGPGTGRVLVERSVLLGVRWLR